MVILEQPEPIIGLIGLYATRLLKMFSNHVVGNKNKVYRVFFPLVKSLLDVIVVKKLKLQVFFRAAALQVLQSRSKNAQRVFRAVLIF